MNLFLSICIKLLPFYSSILLGFFAGKYLQVRRESIGALLLYIFTPIIVFHAVLTTPLSYQTLQLPVLFFVVASSVCLLFFWLGRRLWADATANILAYAVGSANTGYFGLPIALALWGNNVFNTVILCMLGMVIYDSTIGFFVVAKHGYSNRKALIKLLTLPSLYAVLVALIFNIANIHTFGSVYTESIQRFQGAFSILGPMLIGIALGQHEKYVLDIKAVIASFCTKFFIWPLIISLFIFGDSMYWHVYSSEIHKVLFLLSMGPFAANTVALATTFGTHPQKASALVMLSVLFASLYIPLVLWAINAF